MPNRARRSPPKPALTDPRWKNVLVLGGSYGGARAARLLADGLPPGYRVLLIERQSHFNHLYVFPRYTVVPGHEHKAFIPYAELNPPGSAEPEPPAKRKPKPKRALYPEGDDYYGTGSEDIHFSPRARQASRGPHRVLHATVKGISPGYVTLSRDFPEFALGQDVPYAYLVYALGSLMPPPLVMPPDALYKLAGVGWMIDQSTRVRRAQKVVVVGGGALGIQYASDIKDFHPNKHVTLIHSRNHLLPRFDPGMHPLIMAHLEKLGVEVILNDRLLDPKIQKGHVHTLKGKQIECDYLMLCTGQAPNTALLADSFAAASLSPLTGHVTVLRSMQICPYDLPSLSGSNSNSSGRPSPDSSDSSRSSTTAESHRESTLGLTTGAAQLPLPPPAHTPWPNIFAVGDAANAFGAIKAGHTAYYQAEVAGRNILRLIERAQRAQPSPTLTQPYPEQHTTLQVPDEELELEEYAPGAPAIKVTVGIKAGIIQNADGIEETGCAEDLDAAYMWKAVGVDPGDMWA